MTPEVLEQEDTKKTLSRRSLLLKLGILFNGAVAIAVIVPVVDYLIGPALKKHQYNKWISLGSIDQFPVGQTRLAKFQNPNALEWDGDTGKTPCWVRRTPEGEFQVFAVNCTHLGCPVRWFPQSELFMCPCHGGVFYADGERAAGPPPRGLYQYKYRVSGGELHIFGGEMPTLATPA